MAPKNIDLFFSLGFMKITLVKKAHETTLFINKIISLLLASTISLLILSSSKSSWELNPTVYNGYNVDSTLINDSIGCHEDYDPLCSWYGINYSNSYYASNFGSGSSYVEVKCYEWIL